MSTAERNRNLKKVLEQAFGKGKVSVTGSRGTAYGWVKAHIHYSPRNQREAQELRSHVHALIKAAKIEIGTYGYDDPGSDYGYGSKINIDFDTYREKADFWGDEAWKQHLSAANWDAMQKEGTP
jgi:hypothetical protein